ncbi:MAG: MFS transporter, partial [Woeseiaceae bacterium]
MSPSDTAAVGNSTVSFSTKFFWSFGGLATAFMLNVVAGFALYFMIAVLNINPALAGSILFAVKVFDVVTDPIVGSWSDRIQSKYGRRRPFLLVGSFLSAISFAMIFTTPLFENSSLTILYICASLMLHALGYTIFNIPYISMPSEMTED